MTRLQSARGCALIFTTLLTPAAAQVGHADRSVSSDDMSGAGTTPASFEVGSHSHESRSDDHAPIGVMQDHLHGAGEWMISYRFMRMEMNGSRAGTRDLVDEDVVDPNGFGFIVTPTEMTMDMHMIGGMYAPTDSVTLMAMVPYHDIEMDHLTRIGGRFTTESSGLGDVALAALYRLHDDERLRVHANLGITAPTGSIDEEDENPMSMGEDVQLPYPMQLGSGTWDARPGVTASYLGDGWSCGAQGIGTLRLGRNDRDYSLGDRLDLTAWAAVQASRRVSFSARLAYVRLTNIDGADEDVNPAVVPTADPNLRAMTRVDGLVGVNALLGGGNRLALEFGWPIHQDLTGPQLETDWIGTLGWQLSF